MLDKAVPGCARRENTPREQQLQKKVHSIEMVTSPIMRLVSKCQSEKHHCRSAMTRHCSANKNKISD
jgi:hypothetical protein